MASAKALDLLNAGINPDALAARQRTKGTEGQAITLSEADVRKLLLIEMQATGNENIMNLRRIERLGKAENRLKKLAAENKMTPFEMLAYLRDTADIPEELLTAVANGEADPKMALEKPSFVDQQIRKDREDAATQASEQSVAEIPPEILDKFNTTVNAYGSPGDRAPAMDVLMASMTLSKAARYAVAAALLSENYGQQ